MIVLPLTVRFKSLMSLIDSVAPISSIVVLVKDFTLDTIASSRNVVVLIKHILLNKFQLHLLYSWYLLENSIIPKKLQRKVSDDLDGRRGSSIRV